ncbi:two-component sensor histidine kinase [Acidocella aquatica]|uniref:histidine kinase n=1 Tax=Acidocella aquatica TaxID=1922313 RepID=A0ABQ6ACW9_9PROT|nr:HAMP domain-containing sensor histidine kinase [Acidocella aquatica]GLR68058.1 two-component sensor histidine kinase [Acidocella aquatica]
METIPAPGPEPAERKPGRVKPPREARARAKPLIKSTGIRFAVTYAVVFGLSAFTLAFSLWYSTVGLLQRQVEFAILNDATALNEHYQIGGLPSLINAIHGRLTDSGDSDGIYLLLDPLGNHIIGNLDQWPQGLNQINTWYELPVTRKGVRSVSLLRAYTLSGGEQLLIGRDVSARAQLRNVMRDALLWALGLMILLGLLGAVLIRSMFRRMIRDISTTTRAIALGDLTRRIPKHGDGDEFDELAEIINDMLERISRLMDGVRQVSNAIAHDLRTPITRARTRLEDAALHAHTEEDLQSAIERAMLDLDGVVGVFEALLRIAEIEAGSRRAAFAPIDLAPMLHDIDELYRAVAEERGLILDTKIDSPLPLLGDRELVQQAVANLLDNALKFSASGTTIGFTARMEESLIEISIADSGPGISDEDRNRATERFFRAESARSTAGSGLGLALVAAVAQLHNGTLRLANNNPGLRAIITLPARRG